MSDISNESSVTSESTVSNIIKADKSKNTNPLTIVAIFAGLAEAAGTTLALVSKELQSTFVWFVMGFPVLLVILFFLTWNFNSKVMHLPGSYAEMTKYMKEISGNYGSKFEKKIKELERLFESVKKEISQHIEKAPSRSAGEDTRAVAKMLDAKMADIYGKLNEAKSTTANYVKLTSSLPSRKAPISIISALSGSRPLTIKELSARTGLKERLILKEIKGDALSGILAKENDGPDALYRADLF